MPSYAFTPDAQFRGCVLVVEEDASFARFLRCLLEQAGYHVDTAASVQAAAALTLATRFDLVLSDLEFSDADGEALLAYLAAQRTPAVAVTAWGAAEDVRRTQRLGFRGHLTKPVDVHAVLNTVERILADGAAGTQPKRASA